MYAVSLSSGLFLLDKPAMAVSVAAAGVILGWPFSILVFLPLTFYSLARRFKQTLLAGAATSIVVLVSYSLVFLLDMQSSCLYLSSWHTKTMKNFSFKRFCFCLSLYIGILSGTVGSRGLPLLQQMDIICVKFVDLQCCRRW